MTLDEAVDHLGRLYAKRTTIDEEIRSVLSGYFPQSEKEPTGGAIPEKSPTLTLHRQPLEGALPGLAVSPKKRGRPPKNVGFTLIPSDTGRRTTDSKYGCLECGNEMTSNIEMKRCLECRSEQIEKME